LTYKQESNHSQLREYDNKLLKEIDNTNLNMSQNLTSLANHMEDQRNSFLDMLEDVKNNNPRLITAENDIA